MSPRLRTGLLLAGLVAALAAAGWVGGKERPAGPVLALPNDAATRLAPRAPAPAAGLDLAKLGEPRIARSVGDLFEARDWAPPPPPAPVDAPPPAVREPPPLPFAFFGRLTEGPQTTVFLSRNDEIYTVRAGDTIAGDWRIDEVNDHAIVVTYLPLARRQVLDIGAIN